MTTPTIPPALKAIAESIARSMREHPEAYAHLKQNETISDKIPKQVTK